MTSPSCLGRSAIYGPQVSRHHKILPGQQRPAHFLSRARHIEFSSSDIDRWHSFLRDSLRWVKVLLLVFVIPRLYNPVPKESDFNTCPAPWGRVARETPPLEATSVSVKDTALWVTCFYSLSETKLDYFEGIHYDPSVHSNKSLTFLFFALAEGCSKQLSP